MKSHRASGWSAKGGSVCSARRVVMVSASVGLLAGALAASAAPVAVASDGRVSRSASVTPASSAEVPWSRVVAHFQRAALRAADERCAASIPVERSTLATQVLQRGMVGREVAALQLLLAEAGFPSGPIDGHFGVRTETATRRYQMWLGLDPDGVAGRETLGELTAPPPRLHGRLEWPVRALVTSAFGLRAGRFHAGIDLTAPLGTEVAAAGPGRVTWAGWRDGGWGKLVVIAHGDGVRSFNAHLDSVDVRVGETVAAGARIGRVGATGRATGPHLHFEVRLRGASVDPESALRRSR